MKMDHQKNRKKQVALHRMFFRRETVSLRTETDEEWHIL